MTMLNRDCPICGLQGGLDASHTCGVPAGTYYPATGSGPHDSPFSACPNCAQAQREMYRLRAENESLRFDLDQALKANDMSIEDCMKLRAELDALKGELTTAYMTGYEEGKEKVVGRLRLVAWRTRAPGIPWQIVNGPFHPRPDEEHEGQEYQPLYALESG